MPDLIEYPSVVAGSFASDFLALPEEVLITTLIHHQHFFPVVGGNGKLLPAFLAVTNTQPVNDRAIAVNAGRVVTARLRDARFFWDSDRTVGLEARLKRLDTVLFHKALGSYLAKTQRVQGLTERLAGHFGVTGPRLDAALEAARLLKADLATDMVGEFPELQGVMGGIYARDAGRPEATWKAIYHQYQPVAVEADAAPAAAQLGEAGATWATVALADRLDTMVGLFLAGERPTGSRDPFGLRRAAHGVVRILLDAKTFTGVAARPSIGELIEAAVAQFPSELQAKWADAKAPLEAFLRERLEHALTVRGAKVPHVRAAVRGRAVADIRPAEAEANVRELPAVADTPSFRQLAEAFKRVRNIARELKDTPPLELAALRGRLHEAAELALVDEMERRRAARSRAPRRIRRRMPRRPGSNRRSRGSSKRSL